MILGQGTATSDAEIVAEYERFLVNRGGIETPAVLDRVMVAAQTVCKRIGKPISEWTADDLLALVDGRCKSVVYGYASFVAFLLFRGYLRIIDLDFYVKFPTELSRTHRPTLKPIKDRIIATHRKLGYVQTEDTHIGTYVNLLSLALIYARKPLDKLTRADFDEFAVYHSVWYRTRYHKRTQDPRLARVEILLVDWGILPPSRRVFTHETHFEQLKSESIKKSILEYMRWCDAKYKPSTIDSARAAILNFFLWLQSEYPECTQLSDVTREIATTYLLYLKEMVLNGKYSPKYRNDLYMRMRLFYEYAITERFESSPDRNPFGIQDTPKEPDSVPRYLSDAEIQTLLRYCQSPEHLIERVVVIVALHTGLRVAELTKLRTGDIVQIQGGWKIHVHEGKGLKDRVIPLTALCHETLMEWQQHGWERINDYLFTTRGKVWYTGKITGIIRELGNKLGIKGLTPHRFRHTFAVGLLNYGMRESALQKLMGHATLNMTLEYGRILDNTVEKSFTDAVGKMQTNTSSWVPNFFVNEEYEVFAQTDNIRWIRLGVGYCRRNQKLHCESDVKCMLCDRFAVSVEDLPQLYEMRDRFTDLKMPAKANAVNAQITRIEGASTEESQEHIEIPLVPARIQLKRLN